MRRILRIIIGSLCLLLGLAGLVLPMLQGWLFLSLGVLILSVDIPLFARAVCWLEDRFPKSRKPLERFRNYLGKEKNTFPPCPPQEP